MKYRSEIDGLRAVAVLPVILFHAGFKLFEGGFVGVDIFFVISGYLITTIILSDLNKQKFSIVTFYERRARRILPALFFVMLCCIPFAWLWLLPNHMKDFSQSLTAVSAFSSNILFWRESDYFATAAELKPLLHTWSLAVEEQYYVIFPLFLLALWKLRKRWIFGSLLIVGLASFFLAQWGAYNMPAANFFLLPTRGWELAIGALIAFYFLYKQEHEEFIRSRKKTSELLGFVGLLLISYAIFAFDRYTPFPSIYALIPTVGTALIIIFSTQETIVGRCLGLKPMVGIGLISYSTYLWHQPLFVFARHRSTEEPGTALLLVLSASSILLAYISWRFVEGPFRNKQWINRKGVFVFAVVGSVAFAAAGIAGSVTDGFIGRYDSSLHEFLKVDQNPRYVSKQAKALIDRDFVQDGRVHIVLIGDSYAEDLVNAVYENGYDKQLEISFHNISAGCGNLYLEQDFTNFIEPRNLSKCRDAGWFEDERLRDRMKQADAIWLVSSWSLWQAELIKQSVDNLIADFGDKVVVFSTKHFGSINLGKILAETDGNIKNYKGLANQERIDVNELMKERLSNHKYIDLFRLFCSDGYECRVIDEQGKLLTFDGGHLTKEGAEYFGRLLADDPIFSGYLKK